MTPNAHPVALPLAPHLATTPSLTGYCVSKNVFIHVEQAWAEFTTVKTFDGKIVNKVIKDYYAGKDLDPVDESDVQSAVIREQLAIAEFVLSACYIYHSLPGFPCRMAVGVRNKSYRLTSAIAILENIDPDHVSYAVEQLRQLREHDFTKGSRQDETVRFFFSELMMSSVKKILNEMVKTKMRSVKLADRRQWQI